MGIGTKATLNPGQPDPTENTGTRALLRGRRIVAKSTGRQRGFFASGQTEPPGGVVLPASGQLPDKRKGSAMSYRREVQLGVLLITTNMFFLIIIGVLDARGF